MEGHCGNKLNIVQRFAYSLVKKLILPTDYLDGLGGIFHLEHHRKIIKKSGTLIGTDLLRRFAFHNGVTNQGKNYLLNAGFVSGTQILSTSWYMSLIDDTGFTTLSSADTYTSHGGWAEFTSYTESTRVAWGPATSTAQLVTNPSLCVFDISANGTLAGAFIASGSTKGDVGAGPTLWTTGQFGSTVPVTGGTDQIRLTYNLAA